MYMHTYIYQVAGMAEPDWFIAVNVTRGCCGGGGGGGDLEAGLVPVKYI
jgi:hypothetical protein